MAFTQIKPEDIVGKQVTDLPDIPEATAYDVKQQFDKMAEEVIIPAFNKLISELEKTTGADNIGAKVPTGVTSSAKVGAILTALAEKIVPAEEAAIVLKGIRGVTNSVTNDSTLLPTGFAITQYVQNMGGGDMIRSIYDPDLDGVVNDSEMLGGVEAEQYQQKTDDNLETESKEIVGAVNELLEKTKNGGKMLIGEDFSEDKTYSAGDYAIRNNSLYVFNVDKPAGGWDESLARQTMVTEELKNFTNAANEIGDAIAALGVEVPDGSTFSDMADIIEQQLYKRVITETLTGVKELKYNRDKTSVSDTVAFIPPFQGTPVVFLSASNTGGGKESVVDGSLSKDGFTLQLKAPSGGWSNAASYTAVISWTATYTRE